MKTFTFACLPLLLVTAGCGQVIHFGHPTVAGSGSHATEVREVSGFREVSLGGSGRLTLIQGDEESLTITGDDNLLEHIVSRVSGDHLQIGPEQVSLRPTRDLEYVLKLKNLQRLDLAGSLNATADSLVTDTIAFHISGSGNIRIGQLEAGQSAVHVSGSGKVDLAGRVDTQALRVSGSGNYRADNLESRRATIRISGSGDATVWVNEHLDVSISGSGSVGYYGSPQTSQSISGSGKIRSLGTR